jgi:hypothetical protein
VDDPAYGSAISRRDFFTACSLLAAGLVACTTLTDHTRTASTFIIDPSPEEYMPALRDLIRIMLPFEHREFPLSVEQVETRLLRLFPLEQERRFMGLQRTLVFFNQIDLVVVPERAKVLIEEERKAADAPARLSRGELRRLIRERIARETAVFSDFAASLEPKVRYFTALPPERQREYFELWAGSELLIKREFAGGLRYLVMATAYSDESVWPALGYDGPLVERDRKTG